MYENVYAEGRFPGFNKPLLFHVNHLGFKIISINRHVCRKVSINFVF